MMQRRLMRRGSRTKLAKYTEQCLNAIDLSDMPPVIYVPYGMRREVRLAWDGTITKLPPDAKENVARVSRADPLGLVLAMLQGQPIPVFRILKKADGKFDVTTDLEVPTLELRAEISWELLRIFGNQLKKEFKPSDYETMVNRMAGDDDAAHND